MAQSPATRPLLLTRPRPQSEAFADVLAEALPGRFRSVIAPVMEITALPGPVVLDGIAALVFTSANGVAQFTARTAVRRLPAYCVGEITAEAARAAGFTAHSADGDVVALAQLVVARLRPQDGPLLHVRGIHAAGDLAGALAVHGFEVRGAPLYDQRTCPIGGEACGMLAAGEIRVVTAFSPRSARLFAAQAGAGAWPLGDATAVALSAAADAAFDGLGFGRRIVAPAPTRAGMLAALARA